MLDEVLYVANVARRISALLLLAPVLDRMYRRVKAATYTPQGDNAMTAPRV
jgi:hypothetical protein